LRARFHQRLEKRGKWWERKEGREVFEGGEPMMGTKERCFAPLVNVSLEELVPQDQFYRHLEHTLDLSFVREFVEPTYAGGGRPSIVSLRPSLTRVSKQGESGEKNCMPTRGIRPGERSPLLHETTVCR
jgi:hypothetical protein